MRRVLGSAALLLTLAATQAISLQHSDDSATDSGFVLIPGGTYLRGDWTGQGRDNERPVHSVEVEEFYLAKREVTVRQFRRFAEETGYRTAAERQGWVLEISPDMARWERVPGISWNNPGFMQDDEHPVVWVDWEDAVAFTKWAAKDSQLPIRLPTEAEWEYAARAAGQRHRWAGSEDEQRLGEVAWYQANSGGATHRVGSKRPNVLGLYDMSGNVWEWCSDDAAKYPALRSLSGKPDGGSYRVLRGGSWRVGKEVLTTTYRSSYKINYAHSSIGFRLAMDAL